MHPKLEERRLVSHALTRFGRGLAIAACLAVASPAAQAQDETPAKKAETESVTDSQPLWWKGNLQSMYEQEKSRTGKVTPRQSKKRADGTWVYDATFADDLFLQTDLMLPGVNTTQTIMFPTPQLWQLLPGSEIRLHFDHSAALLPDQSHLTVFVNGSAVKTVALTSDNVVDGHVSIPLPLHLLKDYNSLSMEVAQHYTRECEDPFSSSLWTKVSARSELHLVYRHRDVNPDLINFPLPIFDERGYGPTVLNYVFPRSPAPATLEALGVVAAGLGRAISYHPMAVGMPANSVAEAPGNAIVIGTPSENPEVASLVGNRVRDLSPGQGLVALVKHPNREHAAVLVVSGSDPSGVLLAAKALTSDRRYEMLSGTSSVVERLIEVDQSVAREREKFVPPPEIFTLEDLGQGEVGVRGFFASPIVVPVRSLPDLAFIDGQQRLKVYYAYGAQLHTRMSTLEVRWNNVPLKSVPLDNPEGEERAEVEVAIPPQVISPYNTLEFVFHLLPRAYEPCETKDDRHLWGTIYGDTAFHMPRYHWAEMPDLGKIQYGGYPMGIYQDLSQTVLVTPDAPDTNDLMATVVAAGELGRMTVAERVALRTVRGDSVSAADRSGNHLVLLASANRNSVVEGLGDERPLALSDSRKALNRDDALVLQAIDPTAHGTLEQLVSPYGDDKSITILQGRTHEYLVAALRLFSDPSLNSQLSGNVALLGAERNLRTVQIGETEAFGTIPPKVRVRDWGRSNQLGVLMLLVLFLFLAFLVLTFLLGRYRSENLEDDDPDDGPSGRGGDDTRGHGAPPVAEHHVEATVSDTDDLEALDRELEAAVAPDESEERRPARRAPPRRSPPSRGDGDGSGGGAGRS